MSDKQSDLESTIHTDLQDRLTYSEYLKLEQLLGAQQPRSQPPHHDEMLFLIQHQVTELWLKLILHELSAAIEHVKEDRLETCFKILARVKQAQQQLFNQWGVLETLTPVEYVQFRGTLGSASGFQSPQYRALEFILGNKNGDLLDVFSDDAAAYDMLAALLVRPSLYDEFLRYLKRRALPIPDVCTERDWTQTYTLHPGVTKALKQIYQDTRTYWDAYEMCEKLIDLEENFQLWRFRHLKTVERIIGHKTGTGGSSGVSFLQQALDIRLFPELLEVRTQLG